MEYVVLLVEYVVEVDVIVYDWHSSYGYKAFCMVVVCPSQTIVGPAV
jgi:hypothetical protein